MTVPAAPARPTLRFGGASTALVLAAWVGLIALVWRVGTPHHIEWKLRAAPIAGVFDATVTIGTGAALVVGLAAARWAPRWCGRTSWTRLLVGTAALALAWGLALGLTHGLSGLDRGLTNPQEYPAIVERVDDVGLGSFIDTFTHEDVLKTYPSHVQGHPLGAALLFVGLDRVGLGGPAGAAVFLLGASSTAVVAVLVTVREVADDERARAVAPFVALMPGLVWWVTSADALYATVAAWGIALLVLATARAPGRSSTLLAIGAGLVWGLGMNLTYGLGPAALIGVVVVASRRRWDVLAWAAVGGIAVFLAFAAAGFVWFAGLAATGRRYYAGIASVRPGAFFALLGNPAAFALATGPAAWIALARVRDRDLLQLGGSAFVAAAVANLSGFSKAEVERIWLPFALWTLVLAGGLVDRPIEAIRSGPTVRWSWSPGWPALASAVLVGQVLLGVAIETLVRTSW